MSTHALKSPSTAEGTGQSVDSVKLETRERRAASLAVAALVVLGFVLRLIELQRPDLGLDGGATLSLSQVPIADLFAINAADVHPPLFFMLVWLWDSVAGSTPFALRYFSVLWGVLSIPLMWAFARKLGGDRVGVLAAALLTIWPPHVHYSRTVREMVFAVMLSTLTLALLVRTAQKPVEGASGRSSLALWGAYAVALAVTAWSSYIAMVLMPLHAAVVWLTGCRWRQWLQSLGVTALLVLPWAAIAVPPIIAKLLSGTNTRANPSDVASLPEYLRQFSVVMFGQGEPVAPHGDVGLPALLVFIGVVAFAALRPNRERLLAVLAATAAGVFLVFAFVRVWANLHQIDRYLVFLVPAMSLLFALSLVRIGGGPVLRVALLVPFAALAVGRMDYYWDPVPHAKDFWDPQGTIAALDESVAPCDTILFLHIEQAGYYRSIGTTRVRSEVVPVEPFYMIPDKYERTGRVLADPPAGRLWVLSYLKGLRGASDALAWLDGHYFPAERRELEDSMLYAYLPPRPAAERPVGVQFGDFARLHSVAVQEQGNAGDGITVELRWEVLAAPSTDYHVFVHLIDANGERWAQHDGVPGATMRPTTTWTPGVTVIDRHGLLLPDDIPPGEYQLFVGLYTPEERLKTADGRDSISIGSVTTLEPRTDGQWLRVGDRLIAQCGNVTVR